MNQSGTIEKNNSSLLKACYDLKPTVSAFTPAPSPYKRKLSFNERAFLVGAQLSPPMANQIVFEGKGKLDCNSWRNAVAIASNANPGSRLVLRGVLGACRWEDSGITPPVIEVIGSRWNGYSQENAPFLDDRFNPKCGPTCEVVLVQGNTPRVIFRTLHGVMDGRGTLTWAEDVFRALRGEPCVGSSSSLTDTEVARHIQKNFRKQYPTEHIPPTGKADMNESGFVWKRINLKMRPHHLLAQIAILTAQEAWRYSDGIVRIGIPVDMRPRMPGIISTGNLTFAIYVEIQKDSTPEQIAADIDVQLRDKREGMLSRGDDLVRYAPQWLMKLVGARIMHGRLKSGIYSISGFISNFGRMKLTDYYGGGFKTTGLFAIPPANEYAPYFLVIIGYEDTVELILTLPRKLATDNRLDRILDYIVSNIK